MDESPSGFSTELTKLANELETVSTTFRRADFLRLRMQQLAGRATAIFIDAVAREWTLEPTAYYGGLPIVEGFMQARGCRTVYNFAPDALTGFMVTLFLQKLRKRHPAQFTPGLKGYLIPLASKASPKPETIEETRKRAVSDKILGPIGQYDAAKILEHTRYQAKEAAEAIRVMAIEIVKYNDAQPTAVECGAKPRKQRRRRRRENNPLTHRQVEAMQIVGEHKGNKTAAAQALGVSRTALRKLYAKAATKLGDSTPRKKAKTIKLMTDNRGQVDVAADD